MNYCKGTQNIKEKTQGKLVFAMFSAPWCMPCQRTLEVLFGPNKDMGDSLNLWNQEVEKSKDVNLFFNYVDASAETPYFEVSSLPTFYVYTSDKVFAKKVGGFATQTFRDFVQAMIADYHAYKKNCI